MALGFALLRWWWLAWVALAPLYVALAQEDASRKGAKAQKGILATAYRLLPTASIGGAFGLGLFLVGMYWMTEVGFFAWPVLSAIQAVPFALFGAAFAFLCPPTPNAQQLSHVPRPMAFVLRPLLFAALYVLLEWARTQGKYAFPWFPLAATQVEALPILQIIAVTGQWGLTFAIALCGALVGEAWTRRKSGIGNWDSGKRLLLATLIFGMIGSYGKARVWYVQDYERTESDQPFLRVGITQSGEASSDDFFGVYLKLSRQIVTDSELQTLNSGKTLDLILWPEGVAPPDIADNFNPRQALTEFARSSNVSLLVGSDAIDSKGRYTSAALIDNRGQIAGRYDKIQLVPMGEFFVFRPLLKMVTDRYIPEEDKISGDRPGVLSVPMGAFPSAKVGTIICYESAFPNRVRATVRAGAQCIALITDDETFGTTAGPYQHADFSVLRAVETGRYLVRAAHTGTSRIIHPTGRVIKSLPLMQRGILTGDIILRDDQTLYLRFGDWLVYLCGGIVAALTALRFMRR